MMFTVLSCYYILLTDLPYHYILLTVLLTTTYCSLPCPATTQCFFLTYHYLLITALPYHYTLLPGLSLQIVHCLTLSLLTAPCPTLLIYMVTSLPCHYILLTALHSYHYIPHIPQLCTVISYCSLLCTKLHNIQLSIL